MYNLNWVLSGNSWDSERRSQQDALKGSSIPLRMRAAQRSILAASLLHERVPGFTKSERVFVFCQKYTDLIHFNQNATFLALY